MPLEIKNPALMPQKLMEGMRLGTRGEDGKVDWRPPNQGRYLIAHADSYLNRYTSLASVYREPDLAVQQSRFNARAMENDIGIRECLESRQRSVALLDWHITPESDDAPASHTEFCTTLEKCVRRIRRFVGMRFSMQNAIWYGKYGIQFRWGAQVIDGKSVYLPCGRHKDDWGWKPFHGDKLVFRQLMPQGQMPPGGYEGQLGIRVGNTWNMGQAVDPAGRWKVQPTDYGMAYFLSPAERALMLVHKHQVKDAAYEDGIRAGLIYGEGIRSVIYLEWLQKQETMAFLMEYLERMAGGIQIWKYPLGNIQAQEAAQKAAANYNSGQQSVLLMPVPAGEEGQYDVQINEPGFGGIEVVQNLIHEYFEHRIKRFILGQILSSETAGTGMGSGVAELHQDTLLQILRYDAVNAEETLTYDLLDAIVQVNVQKGVWADPGFKPQFKLQTEDPDVDSILQGYCQLLDRGLKIRKSDLYDLVGAAIPGDHDDCLQVQHGQGDGSPGGEGGMPGMPGMGGEQPGEEPPQEHDASQHAPPKIPRAKDEADDNAAHGQPARYAGRMTRSAFLRDVRIQRVVRNQNK